MNILVLTLLLVTSPQFPPLLFGVAGQSNASGRALVGELPSDFPRHRERILNFGNDWLLRPAVEPLDNATNQIDGISRDIGPGVGPGIAFAQALADRVPNQIILVPCAMASTTILRWQREYRLRRDSLYGSCLARMLYAAKVYGADIAGFIWYQGESDARNTPEEVALFPDRTRRLFMDLRTDLGDQSLPVLLVQLHPARPTTTDVYWETIRAAQATIASEEPVRTFLVPALGDRKDQVHLATSAQLDLGRRLAEAYLTEALYLALP